MSRKKKKGMSPAAALGLLVVAAGVAGWRLFPGSSSTGGGAVADAIVIDPEAEGAADPVAVAHAVGIDLLEKHGSWAGASVRVAFSVLPGAAPQAAAPAGEIAHVVTYWEGEDPPSLRLGVVMLSPVSQRAVLGGQVVGKGDVVQGATVTDIRPGVVTVQWNKRTLTFDLDDANPREFRAEAERRRKLQAEGAQDDAVGSTSDSNDQEKGS